MLTWESLKNKEVVAQSSSCSSPSEPFVIFHTLPPSIHCPSPSSFKDLFCLAKNYKGCLAEEDLKVPFGDRAYIRGLGRRQGGANCHRALSQLPWETHTCIIRLDASQELPSWCNVGTVAGDRGSQYSNTAGEDLHRGDAMGLLTLIVIESHEGFSGI